MAKNPKTLTSKRVCPACGKKKWWVLHPSLLIPMLIVDDVPLVDVKGIPPKDYRNTWDYDQCANYNTIVAGVYW